MLPMPIARSARENRQDDVRLELSDDGNDILQERILRPMLERLFGTLGKSEVVRAREILSGTIDTPRCKELLRPDDAKCLA
jgi:hypothetical protein